MNPFKFVIRRPVTTLMLVAALIGGAVFGLNKMRAASYPEGRTPKIYVYLDIATRNVNHAKEFVVGKYEAYFHAHKAEHEETEHKLVVTSPKAKAVVVTKDYVCQIHAKANIEVCAFEGGYIKEIAVKEGQLVKKDDSMFRIVSTLYEAKLNTETARARHAQLEYDYTKKLSEGDRPAVSKSEVALLLTRKAEADAEAARAKAELEFTNVKAPFDGIVDRQQVQLGGLVKEGDILTTLSDNSTMWVYFYVPEAEYLQYMANLRQGREIGKIELMLADGNKFPEPGKLGAIEGKFDNTTGTIAFRADFPNPDRLLRHGQTGTIVISRVVDNALVIPQRATFENLAKRYVYIVDKDDTIHQREIVIEAELDDIFLIRRGITVNDKILLEGIRQVRDGEKVAYEYRQPEQVMAQMKNPAE